MSKLKHSPSASSPPHIPTLDEDTCPPLGLGKATEVRGPACHHRGRRDRSSQADPQGRSKKGAGNKQPRSGHGPGSTKDMVRTGRDSSPWTLTSWMRSQDLWFSQTHPPAQLCVDDHVGSGHGRCHLVGLGHIPWTGSHLRALGAGRGRQEAMSELRPSASCWAWPTPSRSHIFLMTHSSYPLPPERHNRHHLFRHSEGGPHPPCLPVAPPHPSPITCLQLLQPRTQV